LQVAFQQADFTGWNLWAAINGRPLLPFRYCFHLEVYYLLVKGEKAILVLYKSHHGGLQGNISLGEVCYLQIVL
jgi:NADH dehydrogenase FAD-containing subunit